MARVHVVIPDEDREQFVEQARREGLTLSAWLREAARERFARNRRAWRSTTGRGFKTREDLEAFWRECDEANARAGIEREPDWEEHLKVLDEEMGRGSSGT